MRRRTSRIAVVTALALALVSVAASVALAGEQARARATATEKKKATVVNVVLADVQGLSGPMTMTVTPSSVPAGKVRFVVKNEGTVIHEMVVLKTKKGFDLLPVNAKNKINESASVGEAGDIGKGKTKSVTLKLKPGSYVLVCNLAKHYGLGMRAAFAVT